MEKSWAQVNKNNRIDALITLLLLVLTLLIHLNSFLDMDVAWHVEGAKRLLEGGHYLINVFDDNSPYVFIFFAPVVWLQEVTKIGYAIIIPLYVLLNNLISACLLWIILKKELPKQNGKFKQKFLYYTCLFILLFFPLINFGHREEMFINYLLPYFFILLFSTHELKVSKPFAILCALLASFAVMQNPFYIGLIVILDLFRAFKYKKISSFQACFYISALLQLLLIILIYPEYFATVVPMVLCYESGFNSSAINLFTIPAALGVVLLLIVIFNFKKLKFDSNIILTALAAGICFIIYFLELKTWYNHLYPALSFTLILNTFLFFKFKRLFFQQALDKFIVLGLGLTLSIFLATFSATLGFTIGIIAEFHNPNHIWNQWIKFAKQHFPHKTIYFYISYDTPGHTLPLYTDNVTTSPWFNAWFIPSFKTIHPFPHFCNPKNDLAIIKNIITQSIIRTNPDIILIKIPEIPPASEYANYLIFDTKQKLIPFLSNYHFYGYFKDIPIYERNN